MKRTKEKKIEKVFFRYKICNFSPIIMLYVNGIEHTYSLKVKEKLLVGNRRMKKKKVICRVVRSNVKEDFKIVNHEKWMTYFWEYFSIMYVASKTVKRIFKETNILIFGR
jgi:hypothetical protein